MSPTSADSAEKNILAAVLTIEPAEAATSSNDRGHGQPIPFGKGRRCEILTCEVRYH